MKHLASLAVLPLLLVLGCASTASAPGPGGAKGMPEKGDAAREVEALEHKLEIARAKLEKTRLEQEVAVMQHETSVRHAQAGVELAQAALARFREADAPAQLASEELDLRSAKDRAMEAQEELKQIEIMYAEQDLDDLTAEFVVSRGRRSAERAQARIAIEEAKLASLRDREHPQKMRELELALDKARIELKKLEMQGEIGRRERAIALQEAENEIAELEHELVAKREEQGS